MIVGARDTINIDESVHEIYKLLTEGNDPVNAPFKTMKDVFLWAACLGFNRNEQREIIGKKVTIFRLSQFSNNIDIPIIKAIYLAKTSKIENMLDQNDLIETIERYANSGINELYNVYCSDGRQPLYEIVSSLFK